MNKLMLSAFVFSMVALLGVGMVAAMPGMGMGQGMQGQGCMAELTEEEQVEMQEHRDFVQEAIESEDFSEWKSLMESQLTEDGFSRLVERHSQMSEMREVQDELKEAWENDDFEAVKELKEQMSEMKSEGCQKNLGEGNGMKQGEGQRKGGFFGKFKFWGK